MSKVNDANVYTAERILAKRKLRGVTQYYIKWKGYSIKESTWEPTENIFDRGLIEAFETSRKYKSSAPLATTLNSSGASTNSSLQESQSSSSTAAVGPVKRGRGRPRKSYSQQRQEQVLRQQQIEQQQHKTHPSTTTIDATSSSASSSSTITSAASTVAATKSHHKNININNMKTTSEVSGGAVAQQFNTKPQLIVFNPQGCQANQAVIEEIVYEPELTKEPILVTDVTSQDLTVTISECKTPEGFFRT